MPRRRKRLVEVGARQGLEALLGAGAQLGDDLAGAEGPELAAALQRVSLGVGVQEATGIEVACPCGVHQVAKAVDAHVPALITKDGRPLMGPEVKQWVLSMMPTEVESFDHSAFASFDGNPNSAPGLFELESYGAPLAPMMTPELEAKINKKTTN